MNRTAGEAIAPPTLPRCRPPTVLRWKVPAHDTKQPNACSKMRSERTEPECWPGSEDARSELRSPHALGQHPHLRALTWLAAMPRTRSANPRCNTGMPRFPPGQTRGDTTECADVGSVVWFARQSPGVRAERAAAWEQTCHDPRPCRLLLVGASPPERPSTRPGWWFLSSAWRSGRSSSTSPSESSFSLGPQHSRLCRPDSTRSRRQ